MKKQQQPRRHIVLDGDASDIRPPEPRRARPRKPPATLSFPAKDAGGKQVGVVHALPQVPQNAATFNGADVGHVVEAYSVGDAYDVGGGTFVPGLRRATFRTELLCHGDGPEAEPGFLSLRDAMVAGQPGRLIAGGITCLAYVTQIAPGGSLDGAFSVSATLQAAGPVEHAGGSGA